jgi:hypothetical protein
MKTEREAYAPVLLTLTTKDNIQDLNITNPMLSLFMKRFNYEVLNGRKDAYLKYVAVPEWQERGAVHYHVALFNMPFVEHKVLTETWGQGFLWLTRTDRTRSVGRYMTKYMTKGFNDVRLKGHKRYMPSVGLQRPVAVYEQSTAHAIRKSLPPSSFLFRKEFDTQWHGRVQYDVYNLGKGWTYEGYLRDIGKELTDFVEPVESTVF